MKKKSQLNFLPYEQAMALKLLGFDVPCFGSYTNKNKFNLSSSGLTYKTTPSSETFCIAPLFQQAFIWFGTRYGLNVSVPDNPREDYALWVEAINDLINFARV